MDIPQKNDSQEIKQILLSKMNADDGKTWYTMNDLEVFTGSTATLITPIINTGNEFVKSSRLSKEKLSQFSTREQFNKSASIFTKLSGAIKNTID